MFILKAPGQTTYGALYGAIALNRDFKLSSYGRGHGERGPPGVINTLGGGNGPVPGSQSVFSLSSVIIMIVF